MLTERDFKVIDFLTKFKVARTSTLEELFYTSKRVAQNRLKKMVECYDLKRERYTVCDEYIYYFKRPKQFLHDLLLTDLYRELNKKGEVVYFYKEFNKIDGIRPDGLVAYKYNNKNYLFFVEIEISRKGLDLKKYEKAHLLGTYKQVLPIFPDVLVVTDKEIKKKCKFNVYKVGLDMQLNIF